VRKRLRLQGTRGHLNMLRKYNRARARPPGADLDMKTVSSIAKDDLTLLTRRNLLDHDLTSRLRPHRLPRLSCFILRSSDPRVLEIAGTGEVPNEAGKHRNQLHERQQDTAVPDVDAI
jgi:hypothetical protein